MKLFLSLILIIYFSICLLFYIFQRSFLYFPQPTGAIDRTGSPIASVEFKNKQQLLTGWVLNPGQQQALLFYGGNAGVIENTIGFFNQVAPNHTVYLIPYRGYGSNSGKPTEQALYSDALYVYDQIKDQHNSIDLMGRSLGSGIATYVAVNRSINRLVLSTPYDSIENVAKELYPFLPVSLLARDKYLSVGRAPKITAKTLILIAENDRVIPRDRSEALADKFDQSLLTKVVIANADHNDISMYSEYLKSVQIFLE